MKKGLLMVLTAVFTLALSITAFAGEWKQDAKGWWWDNGDGTYPKNAWQWCDGNGDGISECYYFDGNGYCRHIMTNKQHRPALALADVFHFANGFFLKFSITYC